MLKAIWGMFAKVTSALTDVIGELANFVAGVIVMAVKIATVTLVVYAIGWIAQKYLLHIKIPMPHL